MNMKSCAQGALVLAMLVSSGWAYADDTGPVTVIDDTEIQLKNGGVIRGSLVSVEPGKRVIVIVAGDQSVIPWNDVAKIEAGTKEPMPSGPSTTPAPTATATSPAPGPSKGMPFLHVESDWPEVELQRVDGEIGAGGFTNKNQLGPQILSKYICETPCDKLVDGREGHRFFFSGPGMYPSKPFRLEQRDGYITARVHGVGIGRMIGGLLLTTTGGIFALSGTMLFGFSFLKSTPTPNNPNPNETATETRAAGLVVGGVGAGMLIGGIFMLAAGQTRVDLIKTPRGETALAWDRGAFRF